jgi:fatty acid desaturase
MAQTKVATATVDLIDENAAPPVQKLPKPRDLPQELFVRQPTTFAGKFLFALGLVVAGWAVIALEINAAVTVVAILVIGLMYAHLVELQHECLHEHPFRARRRNRLFGFLCGVFMFSSYSHYKYEHLRHHALLGREDNKEFFNYRFHTLSSRLGFVRGAFHLGRYSDVGREVWRACTGRPVPDVNRPTAARRIQAEYRVFAGLAVAGVAFTVVTGNPLALLAWLAPLLLVAEPMHFLIELPEHFGLNTQSDPSVLSNTRTVKAGRLATWFTNGNNMHTTHHAHPGVPMENVPVLTAMAQPHFEVVEESYWSFYRKVLSGEIRYEDPATTCMTR